MGVVQLRCAQLWGKCFKRISYCKRVAVCQRGRAPGWACDPWSVQKCCRSSGCLGQEGAQGRDGGKPGYLRGCQEEGMESQPRGRGRASEPKFLKTRLELQNQWGRPCNRQGQRATWWESLKASAPCPWKCSNRPENKLEEVPPTFFFTFYILALCPKEESRTDSTSTLVSTHWDKSMCQQQGKHKGSDFN